MTFWPRAGQPGEAELEHVGLLYDDDRQYLAGASGFVQTALDEGSPVLVAVPPPSLELIRLGLGRQAQAVSFVDMSVAGRNPGGIIPGVLMDFAAQHPDRRVAIIGEPVWAGRDAAEYPACTTHEALINLAFAGRDAAILCPYDVAGLGDEAVLDAHRTHPVLVDGNGTRWASSAYTDPLRTVAMFNTPLPSPTAEVASRTYDRPTELADVRQFIVNRARGAGLAEPRVYNLAVAVNELATNTLRHTESGGKVSMWVEGPAVVCQVDDSGHLDDPLAGRLQPPPEQLAGRGLLLVNQLCDLVRVHTEPGRTSVRVYTYLSGDGDGAGNGYGQV